MRALLVSALLLSFVTLAPSALAAEASCAGWVCDTIRWVCGGPCVSLAEAEAASCSGGICDTINKICGDCIPAASADLDCASPVCDLINAVCDRVFGVECVG